MAANEYEIAFLTNEIAKKVDADNLLTQLAEEATELAQAALKYRRARQTKLKMDGISPTPKTMSDTRSSLMEEISDVVLALTVYGASPSEEIMLKKAKRWLERLEAYQNG